jgi:hypothetical protein
MRPTLAWALALATVPALVVLSESPVQAQRGRESLQRWAAEHPDASKELGGWVKKYPEAARVFFEWDARFPEQAREFVIWSDEHKDKDIGDFARKHQDWPYFAAIMKSHKAAANDFMDWARRHTKAAKHLMEHPRGLNWAGDNLYKAFWDLKRPE